MKTRFQSAFKGYSVYSYLVSWSVGKDVRRIETLSKSEAVTRCAEMKEKYGTVCHKIECSTGKKMQKIS